MKANKLKMVSPRLCNEPKGKVFKSLSQVAVHRCPNPALQRTHQNGPALPKNTYLQRHTTRSISSPAIGVGSKTTVRHNYRLSPKTGKQSPKLETATPAQRVSKTMTSVARATQSVQCELTGPSVSRMKSRPTYLVKVNASVQSPDSHQRNASDLHNKTFVVSASPTPKRGQGSAELQAGNSSNDTECPSKREEDSLALIPAQPESDIKGGATASASLPVASGAADVSNPEQLPRSTTDVQKDSIIFYINEYFRVTSNRAKIEAELLKAWSELCNTKSLDLSALREAIHSAAERSENILKLMVNAVDKKYGNTALHHAAYRGDIPALALLLSTGVADPNILNNAGYSCLMLASCRPWPSADLSAFERLVRAADINLLSRPDGATALMQAAENGQLAQAKALLESGANTNAQDEDGYTALIAAAALGREQMADLLSQSLYTNTGILNGEGYTAVGMASLNGHHRLASMLANRQRAQKSHITERRRPTKTLSASKLPTGTNPSSHATTKPTTGRQTTECLARQ